MGNKTFGEGSQVVGWLVVGCWFVAVGCWWLVVASSFFDSEALGRAVAGAGRHPRAAASEGGGGVGDGVGGGVGGVQGRRGGR